MKKITSLILAVIMAIGMMTACVSCGSQDAGKSDTTKAEGSVDQSVNDSDGETFFPATLEEVLDDINKRDYQDSHREIAPLRQAEDALLVDNSGCNLEEGTKLVLDIIKERL